MGAEPSGRCESEPEIVSQAQRFWSDVSKPEREDGRFWTLAARSGFRPEQIVLEPEQQLVQDRRYAYFLLRKLDTTRPNARA